LKVLLDEDLPRGLKRELTDHDVSTVPEMGWASIKNGALLDLAVSAGFDVFLTADRGIPYQQNIPALGLSVVVLAVRDKRIAAILPIVPDILAMLADDLRPGTVTVVGG